MYQKNLASLTLIERNTLEIKASIASDNCTSSPQYYLYKNLGQS